ncbi:universal stress protein [Streptomyces sp. P3]|uniref:universal stress protein n=1 Tax=Streptomyces sp. P3 TaxID=2135430 RepID=UPI0020B107C5|nr:universal stress protein [Streptomyces sp. P3]
MSGPMGGPVVVGVDGSPSSLAAVETAAWEAERRGTGLRLTHALVWPSTHVPPGIPPWDPDGGGLRDRVNGSLTEAERRARSVAPQVTITCDVLFGEPAAVLEIETRTASLTVVGGRRATRDGVLLHDSVADRLTAHGRCPTLVVRGRPEPAGPVVLADDASPALTAAAEFAFAEALGRGADLVVLHTRAGNGRLPLGPLSSLRTKYPDVAVRPRWLRGREGRVLVEASADAQLVVVGARHRVRNTLPGSVGRMLLRHAHCPVAVVPSAKV